MALWAAGRSDRNGLLRTSGRVRPGGVTPGRRVLYAAPHAL